MKWRDEFVTVPFFDSLVAGELDALVGSFAGDDRRACALEHNVVRWGKTELPPEAGVAVYVGGERGKLAAARIYDDVDPPLSART